MQIRFLSPRLQKLHVDRLVALHWIVFLKTRPFVKRNNAEFTNVSSFTSLLMCSTHFTRSCRILPFPLPTTNNCFKFVYSEITGQSFWWVLFRPPWCLLLWQLKVIRIGLTSILDFRYPGPSYLMQEVLVLYFFVCIKCPVHKKMCWREHSLADTVPLFSTILQFSSELSKNWGTGLPCLCPLWIYCTGQQHQASLFPCLFSCLSSLCYNCCVMDHTYHSHKSCCSTLAPLCYHSSRMLTSLFSSACLPHLGHVEWPC